MIRLIDERIMELLRDSPRNLDYSELVSLVGEWRKEGAVMAKCPHCIEPIQKQATKCNRCFSAIEWFKFDGLYGPCKPGEYDDVRNALLLAKEQYQAAVSSKMHAENLLIRERLRVVSEAKCSGCDGLLVDMEKINAETIEEVKGIEKKYKINNPPYDRVCERCRLKMDQMEVNFTSLILCGVILFIAFVVWIFA